ncbi:MAG: DUF192 domain-containing protein [Alphaproteobacteria bacterium]|nr:MAG: DUF192 domain-containing protein [Alphaproteobacteria bacterium]
MHLLRLSFAAVAAFLLLTLAAFADDGQLTIKTTAAEHRFTIEVVDTDATRAKGLMFRTSLAPDAGMLFDFKESRQVSFWMQNTLIPLDMLFIRQDGTIANIHVNAKPMDPTSIPSDGPVQYVFEIAGGRSVELGIKAGDTVIHDRINKQ